MKLENPTVQITKKFYEETLENLKKLDPDGQGVATVQYCGNCLIMRKQYTVNPNRACNRALSDAASRSMDSFDDLHCKGDYTSKWEDYKGPKRFPLYLQ